MKLKNKIKSGLTIINARLLHRYSPLAVRWNLTNRCNNQCLYCSLWNAPQDSKEELSTEQIFSVIDEMKELGTQRISFSGGEPLLRPDVGKIIDYCKINNISSSMNSNGSLIEKKIKDLKNLDLLKLSLDGPKDIHETIRGKNTFKSVIKSAEICKENNIRFTFATTLTRYNLDHIDFILKKAEEFDTIVAFQPLKKLYRGKKDMASISPSKQDFKACVNRLINLKKKGNIHIRNTMQGLRHISRWPRYETVDCAAGKLFCMIQPNGDVIPCDRISYRENIPNCTHKDGFRNAFNNLPKVHCSGCGFCGALELTHLMAFRYSALAPVKDIA